MRWKLLLIASLVASLAGAGGSLALAHWLIHAPFHFRTPPPALFGTLIAPLAAITYASIFVYRHTARQRKLQAAATALLSIILTLAVFFLSSHFIARAAP